MRAITILLIEDNLPDERLIREMLKDISHFKSNLISVVTLKDGCEQIQKNNFDIILLDLNLPDSTGRKTFQKVIGCSKEIPIILITGIKDKELPLKLIKEGAQDYLTKQSLNPDLLGKSILYSIERQALLRNIKIQKAEITRIEKERILIAKFPSQNPGPVLRVAGNGKLLYINEAGIKLLPDWQLIINETIPSRLKDIIDPIFIEGTNIEFELDHREFIYSFYAVPFIEDGYTNLYGRDITEHKQAEEALQINETLFRELFDNMKSGSAIFTVINDGSKGSDYIIKKINRIGLKMEEKALEEVVGKRFIDIRPTIDNYGLIPVMKKTWETGKSGILPVSIYIDEHYSNFYENYVFKLPSGEIVTLYDDVTDRKRAEEALLESEKSLQEAQHLSQIGSWQWTVEGDIVKWSKELYHINGRDPNLSPPDYAEMSTCYTPESWNRLSTMVAEALQSGGSYELDLEIVRPDSTTRHTSANGKADYDASGNIVGLHGTVQDITERKRAEEALRESEQRLNFHVNNSPLATIEWNTDFVVTRWSGEAEKIFGWNQSETIGKPIMDLQMIYDEDIPIVQKTLERLSDGSSKHVVSANRNYTKNGKVIYCEWYNSVLLSPQGKMISVMSQVMDNTERKWAEQQLESQYTLLKALINSPSDIIIFSLDKNYCYTTFNEKHREEMKKIWNADIKIGMNLLECIQVTELKELAKRSIDRVLNGDSFSEIQHQPQIQHLSQTDIYYEFNWNPIYQNNEIVGVTSFIRDITKQKLAEQELIIAKEHAEQSDRLKSAFLANMSHEIRTPMNGILGFAELLKEPDLTGEEQQEYILIIEKSGARMLNIINDIIDISKIESGLMEVSIKESNINEQIEYIYTFFKLEVEGKGMQLSYRNGLVSSESIIKTDREKLFAILTNLIKNAIKYTNEGSIEFGYVSTLRLAQSSAGSTTDSLGSVSEPAELQFYVKDTGIGIPKNRQQAIFDRFIQADIADKMARQGAGLGLSISKAYVEMLGGRIWVESEEGKGSTFYFTIPVNTEPEERIVVENIVSADEAENKVDTKTSGLKILIAEDDENSTRFIAMTVKKFSKEVLKARTGIEAIEACRNNPDIDLVLMDIQMPEMDGYEATRQIRQFNKDVVIIAQTAYALTGDREDALAAGCNDYVSKPIRKDKLMGLIQKYFKK